MTRYSEAWGAVRDVLNAGPHTRSPRGVALLLVLFSMAILSAFVAEYHYKGVVAIHVGANVRDEAVAYYHARSAMEVARLVIKNQNVADNLINAMAAFNPKIKKQNIELWTMACEFANAFCTGELKLMGKTFFDFKGRKGVGVEKGGMCKCVAKPEDGRININAVDSLADKQKLFTELYSIFIAQREEPVVDPREIDRDIAELVLNVIDWADQDKNRSDFQNGTLVDQGNAEPGDPEPRNAKYNTLAEIRYVKGMTPKYYCGSVDQLTPYSTKKLNVNAANLRTLRRIVCDATSNASEVCYGLGVAAVPTIDLAMFCVDVCRTLRQSLLSPGFGNVNDFINFFDRLPAEWGARPAINKGNLAQRVGVKSHILRIKTVGGSYGTYKQLEAVIDTGNGNYVYWREY